MKPNPKLPEDTAARLAGFPPRLRKLIEAELAAGNEIEEIASCFPAPPAGAYVKLTKPVTTCRRESHGGLDFYERNSSSYSGEFTDAKRFHFVLEPPLPPSPEPDMNAIRAEVDARRAANLAEQIATAEKAVRRRPRKSAEKKTSKTSGARHRSAPSPSSQRPLTAVDRFAASMEMNYEKWHDGIGYDLEILKSATPEELVEIERLLIGRPADDWRAVEALAALDSPRARVLLRKALRSRDHDVALAVVDDAPGLVSWDERTRLLVAALEGSEFYGGLTRALDQAREFHPPAVIEALFRGALNRDGGTAVHYAAMLMFLHGKAASAFDWDQRPFFLRFNTANRDEREEVFRELCRKIGPAADKYLPPAGQ